MKVIIITEYEQGVLAVVRLAPELDQEFAKQIRSLSAWKTLSDEELLEAQTFVAWLRKNRDYYSNKSIRECLENDGIEWEGCDEEDVEETPACEP